MSDDGYLVHESSTGEQPTAAVHEGRPFIVRDDHRLDVTAVTATKPGLDHVTLTVTFADGSTGRVELGAAGEGRIAVRIVPDDPTGVSDRGTDLPSSVASLAD